MAESPVRIQGSKSKLPELRWWWVLAFALGTAVLTGGTVWLLLTGVGSSPDSDSARVELDAIRTALGISIGAGGAFALWLAARRQRSTEIQIRETVRVSVDEKEHRDRTHASTELDLTERRITELYTRAVEQLGSDKAPVRLGGLYALERLGNGNPILRQTIVNVVCAYLRMPYPQPKWRWKSPAAVHVSDDISEQERLSREELQVRLTAQQILASHLRDNPTADPTTWGPLDIDLQDATLVDFRLMNCEIGHAAFHRAHFFDTARFDHTVFHGEVWIFEASFDTMAIFLGTRFLDNAIFTRTHFGWNIYAREAEFHDSAFFVGAKYSGLADFHDAKFLGPIEFDPVPQKAPLSERIAETPVWPEAPGLTFNFSGAKALRDSGNVITALPEDWHIADTRKIVRAATTAAASDKQRSQSKVSDQQV